jgi:hypothetical protein
VNPFQCCRTDYVRNTPPHDGCRVSCRETTSARGLPTSLHRGRQKFATSKQTIGRNGTLCDGGIAIRNSTKQCNPRLFLRKRNWYREVNREKNTLFKLQNYMRNSILTVEDSSFSLAQRPVKGQGLFIIEVS